MEDFKIQGYHVEMRGRQLELKLPSARDHIFTNVEKEEDNLSPAKLIKQAVEMRKSWKWKRSYNKAVVHKGYEPVVMQNSFKKILARHPFPLLQGPLILQLDLQLYRTKQTTERGGGRENYGESEILNAKTKFSHDDEQDCGKWTPLKSGLEGWGVILNSESELDGKCGTYEVSNQNFKHIEGPASSKDDMNLLYTCQLHGCTIKCPCSICWNKTENCKDCKTTNCKQCKYQCNEHYLKLPGTFNANTDQFTMVTTNTKNYHFATL